ncbi:peptidoglycan recognition family protein [Gemmatimonadota bacterium]
MIRAIFLFIYMTGLFCLNAQGTLFTTQTEIRIIPREEWGAEPAQTQRMHQYRRPLEEVYYSIVFHHSEAARRDGRFYATPIWIQQAEMHIWDDYHFADIGYNYVIDEEGKIYKGRLLKYLGAHAGTVKREGDSYDPRIDPDYGRIGIVLTGNFEEDIVTEEQRRSALWLVKYLKIRFPQITNDKIVGHRDIRDIVAAQGHHVTGQRKTCPGRNLYNFITTVTWP